MRKIALVIGNDTAVGDFAALILKRINIEVLRAENGHLGIKMTLAHRPDIILCGHHMPYCTGLDVLKTIRTYRRTRHIPFISMLSDYGATARRHLQHGAHAALTPPFGAPNLLNTVCNALKQAASANKVELSSPVY